MSVEGRRIRGTPKASDPSMAEDNSPPTNKTPRRSRKVDYAALAGVSGSAVKTKVEGDVTVAATMLDQGKLINTIMGQRDKLMRERILLSGSQSLIDYDLMHPKVTQTLVEFEKKHGFESRVSIPQQELDELEDTVKTASAAVSAPVEMAVEAAAPESASVEHAIAGVVVKVEEIPPEQEPEEHMSLSVRVPVALTQQLSVSIPIKSEEKKPTQEVAVASLPTPVPEAKAFMAQIRLERQQANAEQLADRARRDGQILQRVSELKTLNLWSADRLTKQPEPPRVKVHMDYLLEEMLWLSNDMMEERKWKQALARKISRAVQKYWEQQSTKSEREKKAVENQVRRIASNIAKDIRKFWSQIEKLVKFKHDSKLEEKKKEVLDKKLEILVGQSERYSDLLARDLAGPVASPAPAPAPEEPRLDEPEPRQSEYDGSTDALGSLTRGTHAGSGSSSDFPDKDQGSGAMVVEDADHAATSGDEFVREQRERASEMIRSRSGRIIRRHWLPALKSRQREEEAKQTVPEPASTVAPTGDEEDEIAKDKSAALRNISTQARESQPTGTSLATTKVRTRVPFLLKGTLREYQHVGLDWLVSLYDKRLNGILADEMGLGKTIQTISLLAYLACEKGIWGPHLIIVPTSVMLNWECEFKKWCPAFKILTYYGSAKERRLKRQGWTRTNAFHVCITSYQLAVQDHLAFRRKKWKYLILDEAHNIKNFKSQRWQTLVSFNSKRRILLTGTPLQNNLMELWALMHFMMPHVFESHAEFKEWFSNPMNDMVEGNTAVNTDIVSRLHAVIRPFMLRRMKSEVETQLPSKHEHVVSVQLSKRQKLLYEEFMQRSDTQKSLSGGNFLSMMNVLMQLRKVCNHPDLFEEHPILSPFDMMPNPIERLRLGDQDQSRCAVWYPSLVHGCVSSILGGSVVANADYTAEASQYLREQGSVLDALRLDVSFLNLLLVEQQLTRDLMAESSVVRNAETSRVINMDVVLDPAYDTPSPSSEGIVDLTLDLPMSVEAPVANLSRSLIKPSGQREPLLALSRESRLALFGDAATSKVDSHMMQRVLAYREAVVSHFAYVNKIRASARGPLYGAGLLKAVHVPAKVRPSNYLDTNPRDYLRMSNTMLNLVKTPSVRYDENKDMLHHYCFLRPAARAPPMQIHVTHPKLSLANEMRNVEDSIGRALAAPESSFLHEMKMRQSLYFPDRNLLQYDCGKLQTLALLLRQFKAGGHKVLIFTQMSKMLDILEKFLTFHGLVYLRLDGATKPEARQLLMERFNNDPKVFCFILSTRSGGVGVNLTGADTVVFYDSDWNPAMDAQAQDRCHRIGQTRDVHVYRLVSQHTVEENIFLKATQKRYLDQLVITKGNFTTEFFTQKNLKDLLVTKPTHEELEREPSKTPAPTMTKEDLSKALAAVEDDDDVAAAKNVEKELKLTNAMDTAENQDDVVRAEQEVSGLVEEEQVKPTDLAQPDQEMAQEQELGGEVMAADGDLEAQLNPIQRYAVKFMENVEGVDSADALREMEEELQKQEQNKFQIEEALRLREEEEARNEDDDEILFYEVDASTGAVYTTGVRSGAPEMTSSARAVKEKAYSDMQAFYENMDVPTVTSIMSPTANAANEQQKTQDGVVLKLYAPPMDDDEDVYGPVAEEYEDSTRDLIDTERKKTEKKKKLLRKKRKTFDSDLGQWMATDSKRESRKRELYYGEDSEYQVEEEVTRTKRRAPASAAAPLEPGYKQAWTPAHDAALRDVVDEFGDQGVWELASDSVNQVPSLGRTRFTPSMCKDRWDNVLALGESADKVKRAPRMDAATAPFQIALFKQAYEAQLKGRRPPERSVAPSQCHESHVNSVRVAEQAYAAELSASGSDPMTPLAPLLLADSRTRKEQQMLAQAQAMQKGQIPPAVQAAMHGQMQQQQPPPSQQMAMPGLVQQPGMQGQRMPMQAQQAMQQRYPPDAEAVKRRRMEEMAQLQQIQQQDPARYQQIIAHQQALQAQQQAQMQAQQQAQMQAQQQQRASRAPYDEMQLGTQCVRRFPDTRPDVNRILSNQTMTGEQKRDAIMGIWRRYQSAVDAQAQGVYQQQYQGQAPPPQGYGYAHPQPPPGAGYPPGDVK